MLKKESPPPEQSARANRSSPGNLRRLLIGDILFPFAWAFLPVSLALLAGPAVAAAEGCPLVSVKQLAGALPGKSWMLAKDQDGQGCVFMGESGDMLILTVFRSPSAGRAKELYDSIRKTLSARMPIGLITGIGDETQAGATGTASEAERPEAAVISLSGDYIVWVSFYTSSQPADASLIKPLAELARQAIGNAGRTSESFGRCEWLAPADADGFLDQSTVTIQRTGANSCMIYDESSNTLMVALTEMTSDSVMAMKARDGGCLYVPLPELGKEAFGEHSCKSGNMNAASIHVWKNDKDAWIVFAPAKAHPESGSVSRLKAVAARVYGKM
jgi:hypothetical protein